MLLFIVTFQHYVIQGFPMTRPQIGTRPWVEGAIIAINILYCVLIPIALPHIIKQITIIRNKNNSFIFYNLFMTHDDVKI